MTFLGFEAISFQFPKPYLVLNGYWKQGILMIDSDQ